MFSNFEMCFQIFKNVFSNFEILFSDFEMCFQILKCVFEFWINVFSTFEICFRYNYFNMRFWISVHVTKFSSIFLLNWKTDFCKIVAKIEIFTLRIKMKNWQQVRLQPESLQLLVVLSFLNLATQLKGHVSSTTLHEIPDWELVVYSLFLSSALYPWLAII